MIKGKRLSFAHLEGDICVYNLTHIAAVFDEKLKDS